MKTTTYRRGRQRAHTNEAKDLKSERQQVQSFFGDNTHDPFFKNANGLKAHSVAQLNPIAMSSESATVQLTEDKKEGDKTVQRKQEKEREEVQKKSDEKEEDDEKIQRQEDEEEEMVQMKSNEEEEETVQMKSADDEEEQVQTKGDEKEDETVQRKESSTSNVASPINYVHSLNGKGKPLPKATNAFFSHRLGYNFSNVKVHTGKEASDSAKGLNARAYTVKNNIVFKEGQYNTDTTEGNKLIAHELTHVIQQNTGVGKIQTQGGPLLTPAQETAAIQFNRRNYDERSIRIIQVVAGTGVDGIFGSLSARAVATFQHANGVPVNGQVNEATINAMIPGRVAANRREHIVQLVVDFFNIPTSDTLSIHFDPTLPIVPVAITDFEPGNLRVIRLGPIAFLTAGVLQGVINAQLAVPAPVLPPLDPRPNLLSAGEELAAMQFNAGKFNDQRSIRIIQGFTEANPDGLWGRDTVERIAQFQHDNGLTEDGKVGENTLSQMSSDLIAAGNQDSSIRLIVDFFNFRDDGNLLDVFFDPNVAANASTDFRVNEPVRVRIGPSGINQSFEGVVHTIAHEYEHVRRLKQGIVSAATHEFLGESIEILSIGMPEESLEGLAPGVPGFVPGFADDAGRCLNNWNAMPVADQRRFRAKFVAVRNVVRRRIAAGSPAQQALHAPLLANYNAVVLP